MLHYMGERLASVWQAIIGRNEPSQLAWGLSFGILLGLIPHGNLLAIVVLILVLTLRVNHGLAAVATVISSLLATRLDPISHPLGRQVLTHPEFSRHLAGAWQMPFVPWTDLNNTVLVGSFLIGVAALLPIFLLSYPIFHLFRPKVTPIGGLTPGGDELPVNLRRSPSAAVVANGSVNRTGSKSAVSPSLAPSAIDAAFSGLAEAEAGAVSTASNIEPQVIETRIDVIRLGKRDASSKAEKSIEATNISEPDEPMSEALNYLLRQLRDSRERRAA